MWALLFLFFTWGFILYQQSDKKINNQIKIWAPLLFISLFLFLKLNTYLFTDRGYKSNDITSHHLIWHSLFLGLNSHPNFISEFFPGKTRDNIGNGDSIGYNAAIDQLAKENNEKAYYGGPSGYRWKIHERTLKNLYLKKLFKNPRYFLETFLYYNPVGFLQTILGPNTGILDIILKKSVLVLILLACLFPLLGGCNKNLGFLIITTFFAFSFSLIPNILVYSYHHVISDAVCMLLTFLIALVS